MAATAPKCNVTVFAPPPGPRSPYGFKTIGPNATLADVIAVVNTNFSSQVQDDEFNRRLENDIQSTGFKTTPSKSPSKNQVKKAIDDKLKNLRFVQKAIVRKKIRVENPDDKDQYIIDNRVVSLVMRDNKSGALWTFSDKTSGDTHKGGFSPETENSGG